MRSDMSPSCLKFPVELVLRDRGLLQYSDHGTGSFNKSFSLLLGGGFAQQHPHLFGPHNLRCGYTYIRLSLRGWFAFAGFMLWGEGLDQIAGLLGHSGVWRLARPIARTGVGRGDICGDGFAC